jgi:hypothetical protein
MVVSAPVMIAPPGSPALCFLNLIFINKCAIELIFVAALSWTDLCVSAEFCVRSVSHSPGPAYAFCYSKDFLEKWFIKQVG